MTLKDAANLALAPGSLVVVTGANGNIGSHIIDQLLAAGYIVRGTVRSNAKSAWLMDYFASKYGPGKFSTIEVPDMAALHAFDEAVKDASGFVHTATSVMETLDPNVGIPTAVNGVLNFLESALTEPKMKRVVLTSSSGACTAPIPNTVFDINSSTWNDASVEAARAPPPYEGLQRRLDVYYAGKTESERAAWKWTEERKPHFVLNTVLPNANFGPAISPEHQGFHSTLGWIHAVYTGEGYADVKDQPPQYFVNIQDDAIVHVGALVFDDVKSQRLFAFAYPYNWNDVLAIMRKLKPGKMFVDDIEDLGRDLSTVENKQAEELVTRIRGSGWTKLQPTIEAAIAQFE